MSSSTWYEVGLRFECTQCGNCCTGPPGYVFFSDAELQAMAAFVNMDTTLFLQKFCKRTMGKWSLSERRSPRGHDCVFLAHTPDDKSICSIYSVRPQQCRTWPFWPENLQTPADWRYVNSKCPGSTLGPLIPIEKIRIIRDSHPR